MANILVELEEKPAQSSCVGCVAFDNDSFCRSLPLCYKTSKPEGTVRDVIYVVKSISEKESQYVA